MPESRPEGALRVGVISDPHVSLLPGDSARWHAEYDLEGAHLRLAAALAILDDQNADVIVVCGDLSHHGDDASLSLAIEVLERAGCQVVLVPGNHDSETDIAAVSDVLAARPPSNVHLATDAGAVLSPGVRLAGRGEQPCDGRSFAAPDAVGSWADEHVVWVSHFPVHSLEEVCSRAELLFAGNADDVCAAGALLAQRAGPTIALTGHLHVRHAEACGAVLHLGAGALVEPPGDVAIIDVTRHPTTVRRRIRETDARPGQRVPVLAPLDETFVLTRLGKWATVEDGPRPTVEVSRSGLGILAFDWNGTLVDDCDEAWMATVKVLEKRGLPTFSQRAFRAAFRLPLPQFFASLGIDDSACAADEWNEHMGRSAAPLMPRACESLKQLHASGLALGVVSAAAAAVVKRQVRRSGLDEYLDFVEAGAPNKWQTLRHLGHLAPGQVAFLGDTEYDIAEARSAGVRAWAFAGGYRPARHLLSAGAERVVASIADLPDLVI
jgi:phosphoglycolate phosphatase